MPQRGFWELAVSMHHSFVTPAPSYATPAQKNVKSMLSMEWNIVENVLRHAVIVPKNADR
jgi:hypothetical protein